MRTSINLSFLQTLIQPSYAHLSNRKNPILFVLLVLATLFSSCQKENEIVPQAASDASSAKLNTTIPHLQSGYISSISLASNKVINFYYRSGSTVPNMAVISDGLKDGSRGITTTRWTFSYDLNLRLTKVTGDDGTIINVSTNTDGNITGAGCGINGAYQFSQTLTYNAAKQITNFNYEIAGASNKYDFTYLSDGNLNTVHRTGAPSFKNFTIQTTARDAKLSPWRAIRGNIVFWWMATVMYDLTSTPGQWLSYRNNVTSYTFTDLPGTSTNVNVSYGYDSGYGFATQLLATSTNPVYYPGPYGFTYFYQ